MVYGIGGSDNNQPIFFKSAGNTSKAAGKNPVDVSKPIDLVHTNDIGRKDLDNISPYAKLVNITPKAQAGSVESYQAAAPEFGVWSGNFALSEGAKKEAVSFLNAYAEAAKNYTEVAGHLQSPNSPYAELFA